MTEPVGAEGAQRWTACFLDQHQHWNIHGVVYHTRSRLRPLMFCRMVEEGECGDKLLSRNFLVPSFLSRDDYR